MPKKQIDDSEIPLIQQTWDKSHKRVVDKDGWSVGKYLPPVIVHIDYVEYPPVQGDNMEPEWPTETYSGSPEAKKGSGGGIVAFLERVWLPFIKDGTADRRIIAKQDPSVIMAIKNYCRADATGQKRELPPHVRLPTISESIDRIAATTPERERPAHVYFALRSRAHRAKKGNSLG